MDVQFKVLIEKLEDELRYCCGTTCDKCKVQQLLQELKAASENN